MPLDIKQLKKGNYLKITYKQNPKKVEIVKLLRNPKDSEYHIETKPIYPKKKCDYMYYPKADFKDSYYNYYNIELLTKKEITIYLI